MEKSLNLTFTITRDITTVIITEPESGETRKISVHNAEDKNGIRPGVMPGIMREISSWLSLWLDEQTENSSCSADQ